MKKMLSLALCLALAGAGMQQASAASVAPQAAEQQVVINPADEISKLEAQKQNLIELHNRKISTVKAFLTGAGIFYGVNLCLSAANGVVDGLYLWENKYNRGILPQWRVVAYGAQTSMSAHATNPTVLGKSMLAGTLRAVIECFSFSFSSSPTTNITLLRRSSDRLTASLTTSEKAPLAELFLLVMW